jgi:hypothetical protein
MLRHIRDVVFPFMRENGWDLSIPRYREITYKEVKSGTRR